MRCALLALVALLKVPALRTEPLEFAVRPNALAGPRAVKDADLPQPAAAAVPVGETQDWSSRGPAAEEALRRLFGVDADAEDDAEDIEYPDDEQFKSIEQLDDAQLARLSGYLLKVLQRPGVYESPVLLLSDPLSELDERPDPSDPDDLKSVAKRTRYYRRYPWKRQNSRTYQSSDYDPYNPCTLTRKEVFKLLVALHDARQGNKSRTVHFCNRKRPASAVYTNIRFLGRRRK